MTIEDAENGRSKGSDKAMWKHWWTTLNSPIVLLLVSSIALTGIGRLYADRQAQLAEADAHRASVARLMTELRVREDRLSLIELVLGRLEQKETQQNAPLGTPAADPDIRTHIEDVVEGEGSYHPSSPEFARVTLGSLLSQADIAFGDHESQAYVQLSSVGSDEEGGYIAGSKQGAMPAVTGLSELELGNMKGWGTDDLYYFIRDFESYVAVRYEQFDKCESDIQFGLFDWIWADDRHAACIESVLSDASKKRLSSLSRARGY